MGIETERRVDERRNADSWNRRRIDRRSKEFIFEKTVHMGDTNIFGTVYFAHYFDWQGLIRELFFKEIMPDYEKFMSSGIILATIEAAMEYKHELKLFDNIIISLKLGTVKKVSCELLFNFRSKKTNQSVAAGKQVIAFTDAAGKFVPIPEEMKISAFKLGIL